MSAEPTTQEQGAAIIPRPSVQIAGRGLRPKDFDDLWRVARIVSGSGLAPRGLERPEQTFVAMATGLELGFSAMQALASIAVVNGRPTLGGMAAKALVLDSGKCERWQDEELRLALDEMKGETAPSHLPDGLYGFRCRSKRKGLEDWTESTFTLDDARRAGLWPGKADSNWAKYPARMLRMRALGFVARDLYPDVLKGLYIAEEMEEPEPAPQPSNVARLKDRLAEAVTSTAIDETGPIEDPRFETVETTTADPIDVTPLDAETVDDEGLSDAELAQVLPAVPDSGRPGNWHRACQKLLADGIVALGSARAYYKAATFVLGSHGATTADEIAPADRKAVQAEIEAAIAAAKGVEP